MRRQTPQGFMKTSDWGEDRDCEERMEEYIGEFSPYTLYLAEKKLSSNSHSVAWCYFLSTLTNWNR